MRAFGTVLALLATAGLALAQTAADPAVDCSAPDCNEVLAETCYAAGMQSNMASIITCVTMPGESQAAALKKLCKCYTCANKTVQSVVTRSGQCSAAAPAV